MEIALYPSSQCVGCLTLLSCLKSWLRSTVEGVAAGAAAVAMGEALSPAQCVFQDSFMRDVVAFSDPVQHSAALTHRNACSLRPALEGVVAGAGAGAMDGAKPVFFGSTWLRMELSLEMRGAGADTGTMEEDVTAAQKQLGQMLVSAMCQHRSASH